MNCKLAKFYEYGSTSYYVTGDGRVLSTRKPDLPMDSWHEIASFNGKGYRRVRIQRKNFKVHRLVAEAFVPNPDNLPHVLHIDGDRCNNHYTNLEWSASQSNHQ